MDDRPLGRVLGALILLQLACGIVSNLFLSAPLFAEGGYLAQAPAHALQLRAGVLFSVLTGSLGVLLALLVQAPLRRRSLLLARALLVFSAVAFSVAVVEQAGVLSMVSLAEALAPRHAVAAEVDPSVAVLGSALRNAAHYLGLLLAGLVLVLWYAALLVCRWVPLPLAAFGALAAILQLGTIGGGVLGGGIVFALLAPLALSQLMVGGWLLLRGLSTPPGAAPAQP